MLIYCILNHSDLANRRTWRTWQGQKKKGGDKIVVKALNLAFHSVIAFTSIFVLAFIYQVLWLGELP